MTSGMIKKLLLRGHFLYRILSCLVCPPPLVCSHSLLVDRGSLTGYHQNRMRDQPGHWHEKGVDHDIILSDECRAL